MKEHVDKMSRLVLVLLFVSISNAILSQNTYLTIGGVLKDSKTGEKVSYAAITVPNSGIGTVSNSDGEFILKIANSLNAEYFEVSHLSYATTKFKIGDAIGKDKVFYLDLQPVMLKEVPVVPGDARGLVEAALRNIKKNYSEIPVMLKGFYRESVMQNRDYVSLSEAVIDIYKAPYQSIQSDQVRIYKGRKGSNVKKADTLMVKLQGGPNVLMLLDIVKNTDLSISFDELDNYNFEFGTMVNIDDKPNWVVMFTPAVVTEVPLYHGKLYISQDDKAIMRAEFSLDLTDQDKASAVFVRKKPAGLLFMPVSTSYLVAYKKFEDKYYINYERVDLKFRCDWKRRLFKNNYTLMSEMAITDRKEEDVTKFANQEVFKSSMVFSEKVEDLTDSDFWGEHNIIEPEESIENAIKKLSKSMGK